LRSKSVNNSSGVDMNFLSRLGIVILGSLCFCNAFAQAPAASPAAPAVQPAAPTPSATPPEAPLSADDVSWLFPAPTKPEDLTNLISMADLTAPDPQDPTKRAPVWSDAAFQQFLGNAASPAAMVAGTSDRIGLPDEVKSIGAWHIAGIRFDPGAPGLPDAIIQQYGQSPQIRLIVQPVTKNDDGSLNVHDITAHLIFSFLEGAPDPTKMFPPPAQNGCFPRPYPISTPSGKLSQRLPT
jgi:hypothetical protein